MSWTKESMAPHQEGATARTTGDIVLIVPTDFLNGVLRLSMHYEIKAPEYANRVSLVKMQPGWRHDEPRDQAEIVAHDLIINNLTLALQYFAYVRHWLEIENGCAPPQTFADYCATQIAEDDPLSVVASVIANTTKGGTQPKAN